MIFYQEFEFPHYQDDTWQHTKVHASQANETKNCSTMLSKRMDANPHINHYQLGHFKSRKLIANRC